MLDFAWHLTFKYAKTALLCSLYAVGDIAIGNENGGLVTQQRDQCAA